MRAALQEAERALGHTSPNPAVGAVIVRDGRIIARGYTQPPGQAHAEIQALRALANPEDARGATIYVTLEPCSTHGRTPPCTDAILRAGLARVVIGTVDPNPHHAGSGLHLLRNRGVEVTQGVLGTECRELNHAFNKWIVSKIPWVIAKAGMSLDGRITRPPGEGQWLTSEASRFDAMQLRARVDAILVGANTLRADNPRLTLRGLEGFAGKQPWRVVVCSGKNPLPQEAHLFTDEHRDRTLIYAHEAGELPPGTLDAGSLQAVLADLGRRQITSVLIEGGMRVLGEAFDQRLVDEVQFYMAPLLCGGPVTAVGGEGAGSTAESVHIAQPRYHQIGNDLRLSGLAIYP